jgi:peroxiredoxin
MCLCGINLITETRADLIKVMSMKNNALAALLGGASLPGALKGMDDPKNVDIPADGVTIPEQFKLLLNRFDKNGDGKLTAAEIDAMPDRLKERVKEYIRNNSKASPDVTLPDAKGEKHSRTEWKDKKAVVLFFIANECPVSNGYAPEYTRLAKAFGERGVAVYGVQSDPDVSAKDQLEHAREYGLAFPILMDPKQILAKMTGAKVTPEAVVLTSEGKVLYRGRIDDRVTEDGKRRDEARVHDLRDAVDAVLAGKAPPVVETKAYGCPLPSPRKD